MAKLCLVFIAAASAARVDTDIDPSLMEDESVTTGGVKGPIRFTQIGGTTGLGGTGHYCLDVKGPLKKGSEVKADTCKGDKSPDQYWAYNLNGESRVQLVDKWLCLEQDDAGKADSSGHGHQDRYFLAQCVPKKKEQTWIFRDHPNKKKEGRMLKNKKIR